MRGVDYYYCSGIYVVLKEVKGMNKLRKFLKEEDGMGVVEVVLIIVVLVGLVLIFKNQITSIVKDVFETISSNVSKI